MKEIKERKRQTQSCDRCRAKKRRCDGVIPCSNCTRANAVCTMLQEPKKRGPKKGSSSRRKSEAPSSGSDDDHAMNFKLDHSSASPDQFSPLGSFDSVSPHATSAEDVHNYQLLQVAHRTSPTMPTSLLDGTDPLFPTQQQQQPQQQQLFGSSLQSDELALTSTRRNSRSIAGSVSSDTASLSIDPIGNWPFEFLTGAGSPALSVNNSLNLFSIPRSPSNPPLPPLHIEMDPDVLRAAVTRSPVPTIDLLDLLNQQTRITAMPDLEPPVTLSGIVIADLPNLPAEFYLHLIGNFFTFFHPNLGLINERMFFENLIPTNKHSSMLLCAIYAIGALYSRHPLLSQSPFYSASRASDYFSNRSASLMPATVGKSFNSLETIAVCQASLLLSYLDFGTKKKQRSWMFTGMACRLAQKLDCSFVNTVDNFFSVFNNQLKPVVNSGLTERKKVWWATIIVDTFATLSTGITFLLNESDYADSFLDMNSFMVSQDWRDKQKQINIVDDLFNLANDNRWQSFMAKPFGATIYGEGDGGESSLQNLFADTDSLMHLVQLCFLTRKCFRYSNFWLASPRFGAGGVSMISETRPSSQQLHQALVQFHNSLPLESRIFRTLESCDYIGNPPSSAAVVINALLFMSFVTLHHNSVNRPNKLIGHDAEFFQLSTTPTTLFTAQDVIVQSYRSQCAILRLIYGGRAPPSALGLVPPPQVLVGTPMLACMFMAAPVALLSSPHAKEITAPVPSVFAPRAPVIVTPQGGLESVHTLLLPALDGMGRVWPVATSYATHLRTLARRVIATTTRALP